MLPEKTQSDMRQLGENIAKLCQIIVRIIVAFETFEDAYDKLKLTMINVQIAINKGIDDGTN